MGKKAQGRIRAKGKRKPVKARPRDDDAGGIFTSKVVVIVNKAKEKNNG
jgi:hypothetical protein